MIQDRLNDKEHDIKGVQKQSSELLSIAWQKGYQSGFNDGYDTRREAEIIPQGEWEESHILSCGNILRMGMNVIEHKCKNCGRWSIKWVRTIPDNFCSNCGAKIKGGDKNELQPN